MFGTYGRKNIGKLFLDFYENDTLVQEWQLDLSEVKEGYRTFTLDNALKMNVESFYYFVHNGLGDLNEKDYFNR